MNKQKIYEIVICYTNSITTFNIEMQLTSHKDFLNIINCLQDIYNMLLCYDVHILGFGITMNYITNIDTVRVLNE